MKDDVTAWESLIGAKIEAHRDTYKPQRIEDSRKRNAARAVKRWRKNNMEHYKAKQKEWGDANPEKIKVYQERNKKNVKRWAEEHPERVRELGRINDRKRAKTEKRKKWVKDYMARPEVIERRREQMKKRELDPKRIAWKKAYAEKRKNDPKRIAYMKEYYKMYHERKKKEKEAIT